MLSFVAVFMVLLLSIHVVTSLQTNASLDELADIISENGGRFPTENAMFDNGNGNPGSKPPPDSRIDREKPFTTRFFTVRYDRDGNLIDADIRSVASVTRQEALVIAEEMLNDSRERGWIDGFRYKRYETADGLAAVFISGSEARQSNQRFMLAVVLVFAASSVVIITLIILISGHAVKPAAESYEKQKQFITDAGHELKTPLTLIRTNLEILETDIGANEWLTDTKAETENMTALVNQLVTLARMDEENTALEQASFSLSDAVSETVAAFEAHIHREQKQLFSSIPNNIHYFGNERAIRQLISILMDNAVKYCDADGTVSVALYSGKHPTLVIDNSYHAVNEIALDRIFDRFYRADKARTHGDGFGIGLSTAKAIVEKHRGQIFALNMNNQIMRIQVHF